MTLLEVLPSLGRAATPRIDRAIWPLTTGVDELGRLCVGGVALTDIADEFRTPAYVLDEADFRHRVRRYRAALPGVDVFYAGKSLLTTAVARWVAEEGLGLDVCSGGELATALAGGVDPARIIMHGNAKTPDELQNASVVGVGRIVVDSPIEIAFLAGRVRRRQQVLIRVTPDIDIHGHHAVTTGVTDQKFGFALADGHAAGAVRRVLDQPLLELAGLHCHIGSQVSDAALYGQAIHKMIATMAEVRDRHGVILGELNIGGGHGVPYLPGDRELNLDELAQTIDGALEAACAVERFPRPTIVVEPGRAISARAGITLYRVLTVKSQPGGRTFVAVDGGMSDNPRVALYGAKYTVTLANRHPLGPTQPMTVVGRHCESGDEIVRDVALPTDIHPGDLLAVACTGAYHHSMASNYNIVCRPPLVAVHNGRPRELVRRETINDLLVARHRMDQPNPTTTAAPQLRRLAGSDPRRISPADPAELSTDEAVAHVDALVLRGDQQDMADLRLTAPIRLQITLTGHQRSARRTSINRQCGASHAGYPTPGTANISQRFPQPLVNMGLGPMSLSDGRNLPEWKCRALNAWRPRHALRSLRTCAIRT